MIAAIILGGASVARAIQAKKQRKLARELNATAEQLHAAESVLQTFETERQRVNEHIARANDYREAKEQLQREREADAERLVLLQQEREQLQQQVAQLAVKSEQQLQQLQHQVEELKGKVTAVVMRLLSKNITEQQATRELQELGCDVQYVDAPTPASPRGASEGTSQSCDEAVRVDVEWNGQTQLLLGDRDRMERLVAQCATPKPPASPLLLGGAASRLGQDWQQRVPVVTFPPLKFLASTLVPQLKLKDAKANFDDTAASLSGAADVGSHKDQSGPRLASADAARRMEELQAAPSLKFVYAAQGKLSTPWIARLPVDGLSAPAGFMTTTSPASTHRDMFLDDTGPDVVKGSATMVVRH